MARYLTAADTQLASDGLLHFRADIAALKVFDQEKITENHAL